MTRRTAGDPSARPLLPDEAVSLEEAIASHTINGAQVNGFDKITGSIAAGKSADLIVPDKKIYDVPVYEISDAKVVLTLSEVNPESGGWALFGAAGKNRERGARRSGVGERDEGGVGKEGEKGQER